MGGPGSGRKKGAGGGKKKYVDPRMKAQLKANKRADKALKKAGFDPKENPADRRKRSGIS